MSDLLDSESIRLFLSTLEARQDEVWNCYNRGLINFVEIPPCLRRSCAALQLGESQMKSIAVGRIALLLAVALTRPAFCRASQTEATVNGLYSAEDQSVPRSTGSTPFGADDIEPHSAIVITDTQQPAASSNAFVTYNGTASAVARPKMLKLGVSAFASASANYPSPVGLGGGQGVASEVQVKAEASLIDTLTFVPPTPNMQGQSFQTETFWNLHGDLFADASTGTATGSQVFYTTAGGGANLTVAGTGISLVNDAAENVFNIDPAGNMTRVVVPTPSMIFVTIKGFWGAPMDVDYDLTLNAGASATTTDILLNGSAAAIGSGDFSHTMSWGGISTITDSSGNPITGWSVTSASGYDWSQPSPVPEPSTLALCFLGALILAAAKLRRTQPRNRCVRSCR
jgi:hypothetical protein